MIYVFENPDNYASVVFDENTLTNEQRAKGIAVTELPEKAEIGGKLAVLKCDKSINKVWYDYIDKSNDEELDLLKKSQADQDEAIMLLMLGGI